MNWLNLTYRILSNFKQDITLCALTEFTVLERPGFNNAFI